MVTRIPESSTVTDADIKRTTAVTPTQEFAPPATAMSDQLSQMFGTWGGRARELQQQYGGKAVEQVRARPLAALGVAVAVGVVLSKLLGRR